MKNIGLFLISLLCFTYASAQTKANDTLSIQSTIDACIAMSKAVAENDSVAIKMASKSLEACKTGHFSTLRCKDEVIGSLNGHLVFDEAFADSLAQGKNSVYQKADSISNSYAQRGQSGDKSKSILTRTCFVKDGESTNYSFPSKGNLELAVVAEVGGLLTMKIHVTNNAGFDKHYDDTKSVKTGCPYRRTSIQLPTDHRYTIKMEIINCGKKDCSFVIIKNN